MSILNVAEWSSDQVSKWLSGLGPTIARYVPTLKARGVDGARLLMLRCDDLEYLGIKVIGHQELLLEAVEHLRNFQYELERECVQQLALRVSAVATSLTRTLCSQLNDGRLPTQILADVARTVQAIKPLVCWLDRWALMAGAPLSERRADLLKLSLEAATCAQRERFAEHPARAVAAAAAAAAATADYIIQDVSDPMILQPASLDTVVLKQGEKPLGFVVLPSFCGHHQVADIRFGSPAHASGALREGDEIVQVGNQCVIGWNGDSVLAACERTRIESRGELALRLRRRAARAQIHTPQLHTRPRTRLARIHLPIPMPRMLHLYDLRSDLQPLVHSHSPLYKTENNIILEKTVEENDEKQSEADALSSDESESLSPPASPTQLHLDHTRMYPPKPRVTVQRRHTICCNSPFIKRPHHAIQQFWQELRVQKWEREGGGVTGRSAGVSPEPDDAALYRRDKAVSCSTGLELSTRPQTCLGVSLNHPILHKLKAQNAKLLNEVPTTTTKVKVDKTRGKLDKAHSTPAYDFDNNFDDEPGSLVTQIIPESPTTPSDSPTILVHSAEKADQILDFKKSSSQIEEAILQKQSRKVTLEGNTEFLFIDDNDVKPVERNDSQKSQSSCKSVSNSVSLEETKTDDGESKTEKILETINIAIMERHKETLGSRLSTISSHASESSIKSFSVEEQVRNIQEEIVQAINKHHISTARTVKTSATVAQDIPPSPPPRPIGSQRPFFRETTHPSTQRPREFPALRPVPRTPETTEQKEYSSMKLSRPIDASQISVPLRHITKHDIKMISNERRELPPINVEPDPVPCPEVKHNKKDNIDTLSLASEVLSSPARSGPLSPTGSVVRDIFPSSKTRSLKKKNSMLAKRRFIPSRDLHQRGVSGAVWQRVRSRSATQWRWAKRFLWLVDNLLYAYRSQESNKADCMIYLEGFTVCAANEVKSRAHAFKIYHTGTAFYFSADSKQTQMTWIQLIHRATLLPPLSNADKNDVSTQYSETDYSENESDLENPERKCDPKEKSGEKEKDKSKFGSLKKLTHRMQRSESHENVNHSSTSLDRKYLRFFSRNKNKEETKTNKNKQSGVPVPTEHYRSYRRVGVNRDVSSLSSTSDSTLTPASHSNFAEVQKEDTKKKIPKPINYIHASNPNLLDFEKSDFVTKPTLQVPKPKVQHNSDNFVGFVTLEQFMLQKQEEERRQLYTNRVLLGIEHTNQKKQAKELQKQLDRIVPDVIYGEIPHSELPVPVVEQLQSRELPAAPSQTHVSPQHQGKPISVKGKDGYEKIVYTDEKPSEDAAPPPLAPRPRPHSPTASDLGYETIYGDDDDEANGDKSNTEGNKSPASSALASGSVGSAVNYGKTSAQVPPAVAPRPWRDSLRRKDKVHSGNITEPPPTLKSAAQYTPLPLPPSTNQLHLPSTESSWASGGSVSKLRLMFSSPSRAPAQLQEKPVINWPRGSELQQKQQQLQQQQYPHLQCPPTFQPETYSLANLAEPPRKRSIDKDVEDV